MKSSNVHAPAHVPDAPVPVPDAPIPIRAPVSDSPVPVHVPGESVSSIDSQYQTRPQPEEY